MFLVLNFGVWVSWEFVEVNVLVLLGGVFEGEVGL